MEKEAENYPFSLKIEQLNFSVRTNNCLRRAGINTLDDLCKITEHQIKQGHLKFIGPKSLEEIKLKLSEFGLELGMFVREEETIKNNIDIAAKKAVLRQIKLLQEFRTSSAEEVFCVSKLIAELAKVIFNKEESNGC